MILACVNMNVRALPCVLEDRESILVLAVLLGPPKTHTPHRHGLILVCARLHCFLACFLACMLASLSVSGVSECAEHFAVLAVHHST